MSVNTVLGLLLITATGMVIDCIDNAVNVKFLDRPPFPIDLCRAMKTLTAIDDDTTTHYVELKDVHNILKKTGSFIAGVCKNFNSDTPNTVRNSEMHLPLEDTSNSSSVTIRRSIAARWVPPPSANNTSDDYQNQVLGDAGYV